MAQIRISALTTGIPQGTDETPATDTTDVTQSASGTTKKYIRSSEFNYYMTAQGYTCIAACRLATTASLTATYDNGVSGVDASLTNSGAQAALQIDGVDVDVNDRILVKNQASSLQNGIYVVTVVGTAATNWVMVRATDYDEASEIQEDDVILVNQGTTYAGLAFQESSPGPFVIGTSDITFAPFSSSGSTFDWFVITDTSEQMTANNGYISNSASLVSLALPTSSAIGAEIKIVGQGVGGWKIIQSTLQQVIIGNASSTIGSGGSIASTAQNDSIQLVCIVADSVWATVGGPQSSGLTIV